MCSKESPPRTNYSGQKWWNGNQKKKEGTYTITSTFVFTIHSWTKQLWGSKKWWTLDQGNGRITMSDRDEWDMGTGSKTKGQKCDWNKMGFQEQAQWRWIGN